ncbi:gliding motility-associated C-terminal domain-containing protein [Aequorivita sp. H23M31]|uniref:Gliding motility-associated C-terminal domain-containing protein n=2 Tax=Aequorivita ciconiae TaxID=2494375 RepID=A0A410G7D7_9FLAO|nr:gliding motility-associated C-terminal domain-containing protein [Aequorivita sp. H23M31]
MKKSLLNISAIILFTFNVMGQTTNEGMLYISENTQFSTVETLDNLETGEFYNDGEAFIYSHFNNDGILDFYQETGTTRFIGSADQILSGVNTSYLQNVYFRNRSRTVPFLLTGLIDINGIADFNEGVVDNRNFGGAITFRENANHINTSDRSHVDGGVNKFGNTGFIFPIGHKKYYRFGGISAPTDSQANFKGTFYNENSDELYSHTLRAGAIDKIDPKEYWTIEEKTTTNEDVLITLSWRDVTTPNLFIQAADRDILTIVRWDEPTNMWVNEGGAIDHDNQTVTTAVSGYGVFTFGILKEEAISPGGLTVYNGVTPNDDGINDYFFIDIPNDGSVRDLHVMIFNRWGVKVYESDNYGVGNNLFYGYSEGRSTIKGNKQLPTGTYYYILDYQYGDPVQNNRHKQAGFLYLSGN